MFHPPALYQLSAASSIALTYSSTGVPPDVLTQDGYGRSKMQGYFDFCSEDKQFTISGATLLLLSKSLLQTLQPSPQGPSPGDPMATVRDLFWGHPRFTGC